MAPQSETLAADKGAADVPSVLVGAFANACVCDDSCSCAPVEDEGVAPRVSNDSSSASDDTASATPSRRRKAASAASHPVSPSGRRLNLREPKITVYEKSDTQGRDQADPTNTKAVFSKLDGALSAGEAAAAPAFTYSVPVEKLQKKLDSDPMYEIRTELTESAKAVLDAALASQGGSASRFESWVYGGEIEREEMQAHITEVICEHRLQDKVWVRFSPNKVSCTGSIKRSIHNTQEVGSTNRHVFWVSTAKAMRKHELKMFVAHEIGTHLIRVINDEIQPWNGSAGKNKFGLHTRSSREFKQTEEGLASVNTALHAGGGPRGRFLYREALLYYAASRAKERGFVPLYEDLARYIPDNWRRFLFVVRIKRGVIDQTAGGGNGKVQSYFEGAVAILKQWHTLDLRLLYAGRLTLSEMQRCKRLAQLQTIILPSFARNLEVYRGQLRQMAILNRLVDPSTTPIWPPKKDKNGWPVASCSTAQLPKLVTPPSSQCDSGSDFAGTPSAISVCHHGSTPAQCKLCARKAKLALASLKRRASTGGGTPPQEVSSRLYMRQPSMRDLNSPSVNEADGILQRHLRARAVTRIRVKSFNTMAAPAGRIPLGMKAVTFPFAL
eukprot:COSAG02_NODE_6790_length_3359_cov_9.167178_3_plen_612_part_00